MVGRPYGKLLARYAGPIAEFLVTNPGASRYDVLDFIQRTWNVRVSTVALHHFLKKYGLDRAQREQCRPRDDKKDPVISSGIDRTTERTIHGRSAHSGTAGEFFCPHPVRGGLSAAAHRDVLAAHRAAVLL